MCIVLLLDRRNLDCGWQLDVDPTQRSLNVLVLVLWAIRAPLAARAPKTTTVLDDGILVLYALLVAGATAKFIWDLTEPILLLGRRRKTHSAISNLLANQSLVNRRLARGGFAVQREPER